MLSIFTFLVILFLIFTNGITDASNAVATVVGTKVLPYRKACVLAGIFNLIGIIVMYYFNDSVASTMNEMVSLPSGEEGLCILLIAMLTTIFFSAFSALNGIPASESYELIFSLVGATLAVMGEKAIRFEKIQWVVGGLLFSLVGTVLIAKIAQRCFRKIIAKMKIYQINIFQVLSCCGMSFAHGAQDGLKFIGLFKVFERIANSGSKIADGAMVLMVGVALAIRYHDRR